MAGPIGIKNKNEKKCLINYVDFGNPIKNFKTREILSSLGGLKKKHLNAQKRSKSLVFKIGFNRKRI